MTIPKLLNAGLKNGGLGNQIKRCECSVKLDVISTIVDFTKLFWFSIQWIYSAMLYHRREWWYVNQ